MARFTETDINDWDAMQSDREYRDEADEARYRAAEINYGSDPGGRWIEDEYLMTAKPRCACALCCDPRELPVKRGATGEGRELIRKAVA